jgi:HK97 family phage prohead protease
MAREEARPTEYKTFPFKVTNLDLEGRTLEGYASIFGNLDSVGDIVYKGAFSKTLKERGDKVKFLWQHDSKEPLGRPLELVEDDKGLFIKAIISKTRRGIDTLELLRDGAIGELSIGYDSIKGGTDYTGEGDNRIRNLKELKLYEFSLVTFAANEEAQVTALKEDPVPSEAKPAPEVTENTIRIRVRNPGDFEEDSFSTINIGGEDSGIQATVGRLTGETTMTIQSYVFDKENFTVEEAQAWVEEHKKDAVPDIEEKAPPGKADWPLASRDRAWDAAAAEGRIRSWAGAEEKPNAKYASCFFWYDAENTTNFTAYKLLFCDVVSGQVQAIPRGIFAVAGVLSGARGGADIPEADQAKIRSSVASYYARMRTEFDDDGIVPPWEKSAEPILQAKVPTEAEVFAAVMLENVAAKLSPDTWEHKAVLLAVEKLRSEWGEANADRIAELEHKAGRILAARNAERIGAAVTSLLQVLEDAGIDIPGFGKEPPAEEEEEESDMELGKSLRLRLDILGAELDMMELE